MRSSQHFILATAGHVDHGKSALIKALTGIDPDRLPEEKARGITIDLGFAHLELPSPGADLSFHVGIVDVPGHEDFVTNMVAGVGAVDLALLVVAADDGWMPQTEEHFQILTYLGVRHAVIALTKVDLVQDEAQAIEQIRARLAGSALADAPIVATSTTTGHGLDALKVALARTLASTPPPRDIGKPRLAIDRVFTLPGAGLIATGTLFGGTLARNQPAVLQPQGVPVRIRRIQSHGRDVEASGPGTRTALNLTDIGASQEVHRGDIVTTADFGEAGDCLDVMLEISPRAARSLKDGTRVRVHHGSGNTPAQVALAAEKELEPGSRAIAQLRLEAPAFLFVGDRLAIRDWSEQHTLAGAVVLDPNAARKAFRKSARSSWLERVAASLEEPGHLLQALIERDVVIQRSQALRRSRFSRKQVDEAANQLIQEGVIVGVGESLVSASIWNEARDRAVELVDEAHRAHPEQLGLSLAELRRLLQQFPLDPLFDSLIAALCTGGFMRSGSVIRRATHRAQLPASLQAAGERLRRFLAERPLEPPSRKELAPDAASQKALKFLLDTGEVAEISSDLVLTAASLADARARVREFIEQKGPATISELRQALGSSRRVVVPLLEYFDRTFVTLRQGDKRALR
jgi:selenocysteine-specific elongation factor